MWKSTIGVKPVVPPKPKDDDDWETDADFINNVTEKDQRWGSKTIEGSGHQESISFNKFKEDALKGDAINKEKKLATLPKPSLGYGGKFGVQTDRVDKCAENFEYKGVVAPHASQKDYSKGFGGKYGVEKDKQDKSAVGWEDHEKLSVHDSQKDYKTGFGGQFGVQTDRQDKNAVGWGDHEKLNVHESQTDYKQGFGGQFGVQKDHMDKNAVGWGDHEKLNVHESQKDYKQGFGGQFGVQKDHMDKSAVGWEHHEQVPQHESQIDHKKGFGGKFGVQKIQDKNAVGWEDHEKLNQHESQTDYKRGFGGQFGVQKDRQDKSAIGWEDREQVPKHESQTDYKKGFGGQYGVQKDRLDKSAVGFDEPEKLQKHESQQGYRAKADEATPPKGNASSLKSKFELLAVQKDDKVQQERERRKREDEELRQQQIAEEKRRQAQIEQTWQKIDNGEVSDEPEEIRSPAHVTPTRNRPSIGVRLPFATEREPLPKHESEQHVVEEPELDPTPAPRIPVLPPMPGASIAPPVPTTIQPSQVSPKAGAAQSAIHQAFKSRRHSSDDEKDNDQDWDDHPLSKAPIAQAQPQIFAPPKLPTAHPIQQYDYVPEDAPPPVPTAPIPHEAPAKFPRQSYDFVPTEHLPPPSAPSEPLPVLSKAPGYQYDYVPDEPPHHFVGGNVSRSQYEEPPYEEIPHNAHVAQAQKSTPASNGGTGLTAIALYDYEMQDEDEIGFEANDIITDIEQIDVGWWKGMCKGRFGLFPANYVQLRQ